MNGDSNADANRAPRADSTRSNDAPKQDSVDHANGDTSELESALGQVLQDLEGEGVFHREQYLAQFPQWAQELNEFIDDWLAIERRTADFDPVQPASLLSPPARPDSKSFGDYQLLEEIGSGGMGVIYKARQTSLDRVVALKLIHNVRQERGRFHIEAEAAASLHHDNIVSIYEIGEEAGHPFLSMQYIDGGNLKDRIDRNPVPPEEAAKIVEVVARAVHYAHQRGILHRDLKPANVLLDQQGKPYVTDFGLAKQMGNSAELTHSGAVLGTPGYMSPEQAMGQVKSLTVAADVYGLGAILYALLTGEAPFRGDSDLKTLRQVIEIPPTSPRTIRPHLDRNIETICLKCLEKLPNSRYSSAQSLAEDLARYLNGLPVDARPVGRLEQQWRWVRRHPALSLLSVAVVSSLAIAIMISFLLAKAEYRARHESQHARHREFDLRKQVELQRFDAEKLDQRVTGEFAELFLGNGMRAAESGAAGEALLWFARAARLPGAEPRVVDANQRRCESWMMTCPQPIAASQFTSIAPLTRSQQNHPRLDLRPDGQELMGRLGSDFGIWNYREEEFWWAQQQGLEVSAASWSSDGRHIVLGCESGEVRIIDATDHQVVSSFFVEGRVSHAVFSHVGDHVAVATSKTVGIYESPSGLPFGVERHQDAEIVGVRFGGGDRWLVTTATDQHCRLFHLSEDSTEPSLAIPYERPIADHTEFDFFPAISDAADTLFVRTDRDSLRVFDPISGDEKCVPLKVTQSNSLVPSQDCRAWLEFGEEGARLWSFDRSNPDVEAFSSRFHRLEHPSGVTAAAFSEQGMIATAGEDHLVRLWLSAGSRRVRDRWDNPGVLLAVIPHLDEVTELRFANGGQQLMTRQRDGLIRIWEIPDFEPPGYRVRVPQGGSTAKIVDHAHWLVAGMTRWSGHMVNASLRRFRDGQVIAETPLTQLKERGHLLDAAVDPNQRWLVTLHAAESRSGLTMIRSNRQPAGTIIFWNIATGEPISDPIPVGAEPRSVVIHPDQQSVAVLTADMQVVLIDAKTFAIKTKLAAGKRDDQPGIDSVFKPAHYRNGELAMSPDGKTLYAWGLGGGLRGWNLEDNTLRFEFAAEPAERIQAVAINPNGESIGLIKESQAEALIVDALTGEIQMRLEHPSAVTAIDFHADGQHLVTACTDGHARLFELTHKHDIYFRLAHEQPIIEAVYSPDGRLVATLTADRVLRVWYSEDGSLAIKPLLAPTGARKLLFAPDSSYLLATGFDVELQVFDLRELRDHSPIDLDQVTQLAALLAGKTMGERGVFPMTTAEWLEHWERFVHATAKQP